MIDKSLCARRTGRSLFPYRHRGFTLVEVMMSIVLVAIGMALALPSFRDMVEKRQLTNGAEQIAAMVNYAQGAAMKSGKRVTLAADRDGDNDWCLGAATDDLICDCGKDITETLCKITGDPVFVNESAASTLTVSGTTSASSAYYVDPVRGLFLPCDPSSSLTKCNPLEDLSSLSSLSAPLVLSMSSRSGDFRMNLMVNNSGRVILCTPLEYADYAVPGYALCPQVEDGS